MTKYVCSFNADLLNIPDVDGNTPLMLGVMNGMTEIVQYLLSFSDCDIQSENNDQQNALDIAVELESTSMENILIKCRPELLRITPGKSMSAIVRAIAYGNKPRLTATT